MGNVLDTEKSRPESVDISLIRHPVALRVTQSEEFTGGYELAGWGNDAT